MVSDIIRLCSLQMKLSCTLISERPLQTGITQGNYLILMVTENDCTETV